VEISPEQILVTPGTSPALLLLFGHLLDPGDEVIVTDPYYACYPNFIRYADGVPVYVPLVERDGFQYSGSDVATRLGPRTRAVLVNSPANPTGAVLAAERMASIADVAEAHGCVVVSDEIYHGLSYAGRDRSMLEFTDRAFVLNGFSKAFAMTGWRLGYLVGPRERIRGLQTLFGNFFIATNEFVQWAGVAALREGTADSRRFRAVFDERRRTMIAGLRALGLGVEVEPSGAFYVLANVRRYTRDSTALAEALLERAHVAVTPGAAFGPGAEGYLRFSYAASLERIHEGLRRIRDFLASLR
jgi:aspartate/methionine/tyrosine aminotransferase